ncbi:uncharacterized protein [Primulina huaijiensis]|uniref:uncharacterized protein isoform X2 n=1 Tax=Primulina huaijiensis TaxID=1492673 RepID=UPI003CC74B24
MSSPPTWVTIHTNRNDNERRQSTTARRRAQRQSMTQDQRQANITQRRSNYQRSINRNAHATYSDESNFEMSDATTHLNVPTNNNLAMATTTHAIMETSSNEGITATTVGQMCHIQTVPYQTMTSNFEQGSISTCHGLTDLNHQGINFNENNVITNIRRYPRPRRFRNLARNFGESEINCRWQLSAPRIWVHCQALLFHGETSQFCCRNGNKNLDHIPSPIELQELYAADNEEGRHFRQFIRAYNHVFSFTSMGVNLDESLATGTHGIYTFRAHGSIYHSIGSLLPNENCRPRYMQMWIVDTDHDIDNRLHENPELRRELLLKIQNILDQHNPFVHVFRQIGKCQDIPNCRLIIRQQKPNEHQYSLPTTSQVADVIVDNEFQETLRGRDITIHGIGGNLISIQDVVGYYDPLQYPLLMPYGTYGWDINCRNINGTRLTCLNYYAYMLQIRENSPSLLLRGGRLLQQYVVDNYVKIETQRLRWIRSNQRDIRSELYQGLQDCLHGGENNAGNVGTRIVWPSSFGGSPRDMYQRYQNAMTLVQTYGKPDIMLTMTCNPNWNEIKYQLLPGQSSQDRPDLITRIFKSKFEEFKKDIVDRGVLGKVRSYSYVIEYKKRGLPHVHMLVIFENNDKLYTPDHFDSIVRAEIPSQTEEPNLHKAVLYHMIHGPCGSINPNCPCMINGKCKKNFPKPFVEFTSRGNDSYPLYRRRDGGQVSITNNDNVLIDNGWVVPYNPWLLLKYDCHINVEVCGGIKCVKYIYKYIHKGPDRVALELRNGQNCDEIQQYVDGRWICVPEALWRIFSFEFSRMYPSVIRLQIHTPNQHLIYFDPQQHVSDLLADDDNSKTMLTEFFKINCDPDLNGKYLYREFPQYYTWIKSGKKMDSSKKQQ